MTRQILPEHATHLGNNLMIERCRITPTMARQWLRANTHNRPLTRKHVEFLTQQIDTDQWQQNGSTIVVSDDGQVLDGQHRLHAIMEAGKAVEAIVVYGIDAEAFRTIDTGRNRSGGDVLAMHYLNATQFLCQSVATAARWSIAFAQKNYRTNERISNTDILALVHEHPDLWSCAETLNGYPKERPMPIGPGAALFYQFRQRSADQANNFMRRFYTGVELEADDIEYMLRAMLHRDAAQRIAKLPMVVKVKMVIKAWNLLRRQRTPTRQRLAVGSRDNTWIEIL